MKKYVMTLFVPLLITILLKNFNIGEEIIIFGSCGYFLILLNFVNITRGWLIYYIIQYLFVYLILDFIDNNKFKKLYNKVNKNNTMSSYYIINKPKIRFTEEIDIIEKKNIKLIENKILIEENKKVINNNNLVNNKNNNLVNNKNNNLVNNKNTNLINNRNNNLVNNKNNNLVNNKK